MGMPEQQNVVHESEAQRQYARIRVPASVLFIDGNRRIRNVKLQNLSSGGLSFELRHSEFQVGDFIDAKLKFALDELNLSLKVKLQVRWIDEKNGIIGCEFDELGSCQISTLRHLISSYLSGEIVTFDDTLTTISRENFTRARKGGSAGAGTGLLYKIRALAILLFFVGAGFTAFSLVCLKLYDLYFVTHATSAQVASTTYTVTMPRDGSLKSLVKIQGTVAQGAPLAVFQSTMLDLLKGHLNSDVNPSELEGFVNKTLKGTITSPCNCRVQEQLVADGQFAAKGQPVFRLVDTGAEPFVMARFASAGSTTLYPGAEVKVRIAGVSKVYSGHIERVMVQGEPGMGGDQLAARIVTSAPIPLGYLDRPVKVSIGEITPTISVTDVLAAPGEK